VKRYIDRPLIGYRRHTANTTSLAHASLATMLSWRWRLLKNVVRAALKGGPGIGRRVADEPQQHS
jgi:hypothetical protein